MFFLLCITNIFQYVFIQLLDYPKLILLITIIICEVILLKINYDARVKYKQYFKELNPLWEKLDKINPKISFFSHFIIVIALAILLLTIPLTLEIFYFFLGFLLFNTYSDIITVTKRVRCIKIKCPYSTPCIQCMTKQSHKTCIVCGYKLNLEDEICPKCHALLGE